MRRNIFTKSRRRVVLRWLAYIVVLVVVAGGAYAYGRSQSPAGMSPAEKNGLDLYAQALNIVRKHYVDQKAVKPKKQTYAAIQAMLNTLGDKGHTRFLTPQEVKSNERGLSGKYVGVGIQLEQKNKKPVIVAPIDGSPAQKAGVRSGDVIIGVGGKSVKGEDISQVARRIRGPEGTSVKITVLRHGERRTFNLKREQVTVPSATWTMIGSSHVADVRLAIFSNDSAAQLKKAFQEAKSAGARRFILDLRDNPGGELDQAVGASGDFLKPGSVVYIRKDASGNRKKIKVSGNAKPIQAPMVVLVNGGTASSAEILAGALRDDGRAKVVGTTTFGTGTVLAEYSLSDGSAILLGIAEWLTPDGDFIRKSGIKPDITVKMNGSQPLLPEQEKSMSKQQILKKDPQLERAYKVVLGAR